MRNKKYIVLEVSVQELLGIAKTIQFLSYYMLRGTLNLNQVSLILGLEPFDGGDRYFTKVLYEKHKS